MRCRQTSRDLDRYIEFVLHLYRCLHLRLVLVDTGRIAKSMRVLIRTDTRTTQPEQLTANLNRKDSLMRKNERYAGIESPWRDVLCLYRLPLPPVLTDARCSRGHGSAFAFFSKTLSTTWSSGHPHPTMDLELE
jgi:hypothetical protein